jgi:tetratricopeptide (TPR) repeat protein
VPPEEAARLCARLVELGLGEGHQTGPLAFFLPDPALSLALTRGLAEGEALEAEERVALEERWFENVAQLVRFLVRQQDQADARVAADATRLALGELLAWIEDAEVRVEAGALAAGEATQLVGMIETLLAMLGRRRALERVVAARRRLAASVDVGTHAGFEARRHDVERALQAGDLSTAPRLAEALYRDAEALGDDAYSEAAYDRAMAPTLVAQVLQVAGASDRALPLLETARGRFLALAEGSEDASGMAAVCLGRQGDCLRGMGRLDAAAEAYEAAIADHEAAGRIRSVAASRGQLGTVRMLQDRTADAVKLFQEVRAAFEALDEPGGAATGWHQEAMAWRRAGQPREAERCYLASLEIKSRIGNQSGEALTLGELGNLYSTQGRLEEASAHFGRAAETFGAVGQALNEAGALKNRSHTLRKLGRMDEARADLSRALKLEAPFGLAAEPWKTHHVRHEIEIAAGDAPAAAEARAEAIRLYAEYRDGGGAPQTNTGRLVEQLRQLIADGADPAALAAELPPADAFSENLLFFRATLEALLRGHAANPDDPRLDFGDVVELRRLQATLRERTGR